MPRSRDGLYTCRRCKERFLSTEGQRICEGCRSKCSSCEVTLNSHNIDHTGSLRNQYRCKSCVALCVKNSRGNGGFNQRDYDLRRSYGITQTEYEKMYLNQGGRCKICQGRHAVLAVDHCHRSGVVRGLLCSPCNKGLGHFRDNSRYLQEALDYLNAN